MPVLPSALADSADEAAESSGDFSALEWGVYTGRLSKCDADRTRDGKKAMWKLEFDQIFDLDGNKCGGRLWSNITLEESVAWKIAQFFKAFDVPATTDTDNLINHRIRLEVSKRVQEFGKNKGKEVNDIDRFVALVADDPGYDRTQALKARLAKEAKPTAVKRAPAKASKPTVDDVEAGVVDEDEDSDLEF